MTQKRKDKRAIKKLDLPPAFTTWLDSLGEEDRERELEIAKANIARIRGLRVLA